MSPRVGTRYRVVVTAITPEDTYTYYEDETEVEAFVLANGRTEGPTRIVGEVNKNGPMALCLRLVEYINESAARWS